MGDSKLLLQDFEEALNDDKIYIAFNLLKQLQIQAINEPDLRKELEAREDAVRKCQERFTRVKMHLDDMNRDKDWTLVTKRKGVQVYNRNLTEGFIVNKATCLIPVSTLDIPLTFTKMVSLFAEIDLMPSIFPNKLLYSSEIIHESSAYRKFFHMKFHPGPFLPLEKRDAVAVGSGYDLSENGEIVITFDTLGEGVDSEGIDVPPEDSKYQRMDIKGAFYFSLAEEGINFKVIAQVDIKLKFVPQAVLQFLSKLLWAEYVLNVQKALKAYGRNCPLDIEYDSFVAAGSPWEERLRMKSDFYDTIHQRIVDAMQLDAGNVTQHEEQS